MFQNLPSKMSDWVAICESEGAQPVEIETEEDGSLPLGSVSAHFPGATTLKYRAPVGDSPLLTLLFGLSQFYNLDHMRQNSTTNAHTFYHLYHLPRAGLPTAGSR